MTRHGNPGGRGAGARTGTLAVTVLAAALLAALAAGWPLGGCGRPPAPAERKLVVIGFDAADWIPIDSLLAAGRLPNFRRLLAEGARADLTSLTPLEKSPVLWASIATGRKPVDHGIGGFVQQGAGDGAGGAAGGAGRGAGGAGDDGEQVPVRANAWRAPALWDIANAAGLRADVVAWWTTHPARPIDGVMVSDYLPWAIARPVPWHGLVEPDSLLPEVHARRVNPPGVTLEQLGRFLDLDSLRGHEADQDLAKPLANLKAIYASDLSYLEIGRWLAKRDDADLFAIYLRGLDMASHEFWRYYQPDKSPVQLTPTQRAVFGGVVPAYYEFVDEMLGEILSWFPPDRQVVVLSDHGFHGPRHRKRGWTLGTEEHRRDGIFIARGPLLKAGTRADPIGLMDVAPTLLGLLRLPASREMPGRAWTAGLAGRGRRLFARLEKDRVPSYQALTPRAADDTTGGDPEVDEAIRQQLRSLGYIK